MKVYTISKYVVLFPLLCCFSLQACSKRVAPKYELVAIRGVSWACNVSLSYAIFGSFSESESDPEVVLAVSEGDLLYMMGPDEEELYYRYSRRDGRHLLVSFDHPDTPTASLNGQLISMDLSGDPAAWQLFQQLSDPQRKQLSTLRISTSLSDHEMELLLACESSLQGVGLLLDGEQDLTGLAELISICKPRWIMVEDCPDLENPEDCMALTNIELVWIQGDFQFAYDLLPYCTNLESLIISDWNPGHQELLSLSQSRSLHTLTLAECGIRDFSNLEFPPVLRRLHVIDCDSLNAISSLLDLKSLKGISFSGCSQIQGMLQLRDKTSLRWLGFPENISQGDFSSILSGQSKLEAVELLSCQKVDNLFPLENLSGLKILFSDLGEEKLDGLEALKQLELLVLNQELFDQNPEGIRKIRTSLPDTLVVPGSGLCLGSGWILLLIPLVLLSRWLFRHRRSSCQV